MQPPNKPPSEWTLWAYALVCAPVVLAIGLCVWTAYCNVLMSRTTALRSELGQLRAHAARRAGSLEALLCQEDADGEELQQSPRLQQFWSEGGEPKPLYSAVVDDMGTIVLHSDPQRIGQSLGRDWYDRRVLEAGTDVVWLDGGPLSSDVPAYDISLPLSAGGRRIGEYHEGLDGTQFDKFVAAQQQTALLRGTGILGLVALAAGGAGAGVFWLRRQQRLGDARLQRQIRGRARELAQLGGGLAHEVRNPLHALRINVHTLRRAMGGRGSLSQEQLLDTMKESDAAIDRLDALMRDLLQFTDPIAGEVAELEVSREVQLIVNLLGEDLRRDEIECSAHFPQSPALVAIDPARLRQMLLNVLTFAQHRAGKQGRLAVEVAADEGCAQVIVTDSGPPLPDEQIIRLFEPFQAPAETGSGLGLALVQNYAEASGGRVALERPGPTGIRLRIWLPLVAKKQAGVAV